MVAVSFDFFAERVGLVSSSSWSGSVFARRICLDKVMCVVCVVGLRCLFVFVVGLICLLCLFALLVNVFTFER